MLNCDRMAVVSHFIPSQLSEMLACINLYTIGGGFRQLWMH